MPKIGIVIPTAFTRPQYLPLAYESIASQKGDFELELIIGAPAHMLDSIRAALPEGAHCVTEEDVPGLANKLHRLLGKTSEDCDFISWLGDDDILTPGSLAAVSDALLRNPGATLAFGGCDYIDADGDVIFTNRSGRWASRILRFGPQLIPQPGSLMRRDSYFKSGGLDGEYGLAFDFDLFLKLKAQGPLVFVPKTLAQFRWHPDSLSVKRRMVSAGEASRVRRRHYGGLARFVWPIWEPIVVLATWFAGKLVTLKIR